MKKLVAIKEDKIKDITKDKKYLKQKYKRLQNQLDAEMNINKKIKES